MNNNSINTKNIDLNEEEEDLPLPPPPPPECLIDFKYTPQKTTAANIEAINPMDVNKLARTLSLNKNYENPSSFIKNSSFLPINNNKASQQTPLKRSNTLNSSNSSSPLNNKLNALTTRLNRLSVVNRTSSFRRGDVHHLFQDAVVDDLEETDDLDEESIELNTTSSPSSDSSSSSKEISSSSSSSSASSVIYSTNNSEDLNKLNESSSTTSNSNSDYQSNQIIMDQNNTFKSTRINSNNNKNQNEKLISQILRNKTNDSNSIYGVGTFKPAPPSRSSSLQYRVNPLNNNINQKSKFYQLLTNNQNNNNLENVYNNLLMNNENNNTSFDRSSIYSTFSLRASNLTRLSSFNLQNNYKNNNDSNNNSNKNENIYGTRLETLDLLNKSEIFKIESCYKSMCSIVNSAKCMAELHTTNLENLVKLLDWKLQLSGIPVWVFNTGLNPKRKKELTLVLADKKTGFALWKLNNMNYKNDFKWTKPGHLTFKIFASNIANPELFGLIKPSISCESSSMLINENVNGTKLKRRFSLKKSSSLSYEQQQSLNIKSSNTMSNLNDKNEYIFGAIKFDNDFECSKFYDYYRTLLVDRKNDDLFNPNFNFVNKSATISGSNSLSFMKSKEKSSSNNIVKILYKKITKNSISSPCAFTHVNGLTVLSEESHLNTPSNNNLNINMDSQSLIMNDSLSILTHQSSIFSKNST
jgi:hypothetical protein